MFRLNLSNLISIDEIGTLHPEGAARDILNLNLYAVGVACDDDTFCNRLHSADYIHFDGLGASAFYYVFFGKWFKPVGYREWAERYLQGRSAGKKVSVIGGTPDENTAFIDTIQVKIPNIEISGIDGYRGTEEITDFFVKAAPDICFVGMGMPLQEEMIKYLKDTKHPCLIFACGGWIKQYGGNEKSVPPVMAAMKLEWLFRSLLRRGHFRTRVLWPIYRIIKRYVFAS